MVRYHSPMMMRFVLAALVALVATPVFADNRYSADRYDSRIEFVDGGAIRVIETIAIRFEQGTFTQFYRAIPVRRTDGINIVSARMDGEPMGEQNGDRGIEVSRSSNVRVTWRFPPTSDATHVFELTYLAHGVVRQGSDADVLAWRILPTEHRYPITSSTIDIVLPAEQTIAPSLDNHRVGDYTVHVSDGLIRINASAIRGNGWVQASVRLPPGSVISGPPEWQRHEDEINARAGVWITTAGLVLIAGFVLLFFVRQQYDSPGEPFVVALPHTTVPPDQLSPSIAGALLTNGSPRLEQAMAAIVSLANRGELRIDEQARILGQRHFVIARTAQKRPLAPYEETLLDILFGANGDRTVALGKARNRLMRHFRKFKTALEPAMQSAGLIDEDRRAVRMRFAHIAAACLIAAGASAFALAFVVERFGPWPMLVALAVGITGVTALICFAAHTPLSNEGIRRAREWRGFRQYLRDIARDREPSPGERMMQQSLPYAVALGLAQSWASYLKRHRSAAPEWFRAVSAGAGDGAVAFSSFVASGGAGAHGGGPAGAGAAAGGGASGAS